MQTGTYMKGCGKMAANMDRESISTRIKELDTGVIIAWIATTLLKTESRKYFDLIQAGPLCANWFLINRHLLYTSKSSNHKLNTRLQAVLPCRWNILRESKGKSCQRTAWNYWSDAQSHTSAQIGLISFPSLKAKKKNAINFHGVHSKLLATQYIVWNSKKAEVLRHRSSAKKKKAKHFLTNKEMGHKCCNDMKM